MKKIVLFLLLAVVLVACGETDPYAGLILEEYSNPGLTGPTQVVKLYRNEANNNRIEKFIIEKEAALGQQVAKGTVTYENDEAVKIDINYSYNGKSMDIPLENKSMIQWMLQKAENKEYIVLNL